MRQSAGGEPEAFVETDRIDYERVLFPMANRVAVICAHDFIGLALRPPILVNDAPVAIAAPEQHQNASQLPLFYELKAIRHLERTRSARRQIMPHWIIPQQPAL